MQVSRIGIGVGYHLKKLAKLLPIGGGKPLHHQRHMPHKIFRRMAGADAPCVLSLKIEGVVMAQQKSPCILINRGIRRGVADIGDGKKAWNKKYSTKPPQSVNRLSKVKGHIKPLPFSF